MIKFEEKFLRISIILLVIFVLISETAGVEFALRM